MKQKFDKLFCSNRYTVHPKKIHIAEVESITDNPGTLQISLCGQNRLVYLSLLDVVTNTVGPIDVKYEHLCKNCIKKLSKENKQILKYNAIVYKLKP